MRVIYNRLIPFKGYKCVNLFGVLFVREGCTMTVTDYLKTRKKFNQYKMN